MRFLSAKPNNKKSSQIHPTTHRMNSTSFFILNYWRGGYNLPYMETY